MMKRITEIVAALSQNIRVIPVIVDGASLPDPSDLPDDLRPLIRRHAVEVRNSRFHRDAEVLIKELRALRKSKWLGRLASGIVIITIFRTFAGILFYFTSSPNSRSPGAVPGDTARSARKEEVPLSATAQPKQPAQSPAGAVDPSGRSFLATLEGRWLSNSGHLPEGETLWPSNA